MKLFNKKHGMYDFITLQLIKMFLQLQFHDFKIIFVDGDIAEIILIKIRRSPN